MFVLLPSIVLFRILQQARMDKGWTQKELATKANEKPQIVNDYESGKACPQPSYNFEA